MTDRTKVSRGKKLRGTLLAAVLLSLLLPVSALADPPDTTIETGPDDGSTINDQTPTFTFSSILGTTFQCSVDGVPFEACSDATSHTTAALVDGPHTFAVRSVLLLAPDDTPATRSFTVDATPPDTTIDSGPSGTTSNNDPSFTFHSEDGASFECRLDGPGPATGTFASCPSSGKSYTDLDDGDYTFQVRAIDGVFQSRPEPRDPQLHRRHRPARHDDQLRPRRGLTRNDDPTFTFSSEAGSSFECSLDGPGAATGTFASCSNPKSYSGLADGHYTFRVRATDANSNTDQSPATRSFTVDATRAQDDDRLRPDRHHPRYHPDLHLLLRRIGVDLPVQDRQWPLRSLLGAGQIPHPPRTRRRSHTFAVRAIDPALNIEDSPATQPFAVDSSLPPDTTPPDLKITKRPKGKIKTKKKAAKVAVSFSSEPGATFRCKLDRGEYKPCTSPYRVKAKAGAGKGKKHKISVRAADEAGNIGKPAVIKFKVLRKLTLRAPVAHRTVLTALARHDFAHRVVRSVDVDCSRRSRVVFACNSPPAFPAIG